MNYKSGFLYNGKISASQVSLWMKSETDYINQYIKGEKFIGNKYTEFGTYVHKLIEDEDISMINVPKLNNKEFYFEKKCDGYILNGYIDSYDKGEIIDYKVAKKTSWNKKKVKDCFQLKFYGLWHYIEHGFEPNVSIVHIESIDNLGLELTGECKQFKYKITKKDIEEVERKISEFINWCKEYEKRNN